MLFYTSVLEHVFASVTNRQACQCSLTPSRPFMESVASIEKDTYVIDLRHGCSGAHGISCFLSICKGK